jgi:hypothetical protein
VGRPFRGILRAMRAQVALVFVLFTSACATVPGPPSKPVATFPPPAALAAIETRPAEVPPVSTGEVPAEGWSVDASRAAETSAAPWEPAGPLEEAFAATFAAAGRSARPSRALACAASEIGRFVR